MLYKHGRVSTLNFWDYFARVNMHSLVDVRDMRGL